MEELVYNIQLPLPLDYSHTSTLPIPNIINTTYPSGATSTFILLPKEYYQVEPIE
jgi:hypothetical protein